MRAQRRHHGHSHRERLPRRPAVVAAQVRCNECGRAAELADAHQPCDVVHTNGCIGILTPLSEAKRASSLDLAVDRARRLERRRQRLAAGQQEVVVQLPTIMGAAAPRGQRRGAIGVRPGVLSWPVREALVRQERERYEQQKEAPPIELSPSRLQAVLARLEAKEAST